MSRPDLDLSEHDLPSGRRTEVFTHAITALRDDDHLVSLLGGASRIVPAVADEDPEPALLVVECTVSGSTESAETRVSRFTVDLVVMLAPGVMDEADPNFMTAVSDRALEILSEDLPNGFAFAGATDDINRRRPSEATDVNALVQVGASAQFVRPTADE